MLENTTIARPYAQAAFSLAQIDGQLAAWSDGLKYLSALVSDPDMQRVIKNPRLEPDRLAAIIEELGAGRFSALVGNFIKVLSRSDRLALAPEISRLFDEFRSKAEGSLNVEVVSAFELSDEEVRRIADAVRKRLGKAVEVATRVDQDLIGGVVVRAGDLVIDASLRGRLKQFGNELQK